MFSPQIYREIFVNHRYTGGFTYFALHIVHATFCIEPRIGAGHIGSVIVTCLAQGHLYNEKDIIVSNPNIDKLERLQEHFPAIHITTDNQQAISEAEVIVLAINPWKVDEVLSPLRFSRTQILVSLVSGVCISHLAHLTEAEMPI